MKSKKIDQNGIPAETKREIQERILGWYKKNARELPWRKEYAPYEVWISEMMLQQTQIKTMLPFFHRWMERFPTPSSIAETSEVELLR